VGRGGQGGARRARAAIERLASEYERVYYAGILAERSAIALLDRGAHGAAAPAWHHLQEAMSLFEKADALQQDASNDDAVLRYNTCVRLLEAHRLEEPVPDDEQHLLE